MEVLFINFIKTEFFAIIFVLSLSFLIRLSANSMLFVWIIKFPGMVFHEIAHLLFGLITFAQPTKVTLLPKKLEDGTIVLGSVSFLKINNFNAFLISMAPFILMVIAYFIFKEQEIMKFIYNLINIEEYWVKRILKLYILTILLSSSIPSTTDFKVMYSKYIGSILWIIVIVNLAYYYTLNETFLLQNEMIEIKLCKYLNYCP